VDGPTCLLGSQTVYRVDGEIDMDAGMVGHGPSRTLASSRLPAPGAARRCTGGVGLGGELPSFGVAVSGEELYLAVGAPGLDPRRGGSTRCSRADVRIVSAHVALKPANVGESRRDLNVKLSFGSYAHRLTVDWCMRGLVSEVWHPTTQRSQVHIHVS
jgi:hypothetical protein